uniref:SH2 domain-containing protein n=1 Tax=Terrapene triunguis TaxID=2587831 RepID=A0A674I821_9SAUR
CENSPFPTLTMVVPASPPSPTPPHRLGPEPVPGAVGTLSWFLLHPGAAPGLWQVGPGQAWQSLPCQAGSPPVLSSPPLPQDSAFMVRQSSGQGWNQPFTLAVLYKGHVYNIPIRYVESSRQYALGKDGKSREERFDSVAGIIQHYREHPLVLIEGSSASRAHTCLLFPVKP